MLAAIPDANDAKIAVRIGSAAVRYLSTRWLVSLTDPAANEDEVTPVCGEASLQEKCLRYGANQSGLMTFDSIVRFRMWE